METMSKQDLQKQDQKAAMRVSTVSIAVNVILSLLKLIAGLVASSGAMVSDAIHSASDVFSTIIVMIGVHISGKQADEEHPYGHERMECVAAIILAVMLALTGVGIGSAGIKNILSGDYASLAVPGMLALWAAVISIVVKEWMFHYTMHTAKKINSGALKADAWHHRSDALSSIGSLIGIVGARMGYKWLDPLASLVICLFILKAALDIFMDAMKKMVDHSCSKEIRDAITKCAKKHPDALGIAGIQTREFGNKIYVDLEVFADGNISLKRSNEIAEQIHDSIESEFPKVKHIAVAMKPK